MTSLVYRQDGARIVIDEDDGCPAGNHRRDELCARTPLKKLTLAELPEPKDERGGEAA